MPVPSPRSKLLPARGNAADLLANVTALVDGEICYATDENAYYQKVGTSLVKVSGGSGGGSYDDTALAARVTTNEGDISTLQTTVGGLSNYDDTALAARVTQSESDISALQSAPGYDDAALTGRVETLENEMDAVETTVAGLSNYDDTAIQGQVNQNASDIDSLEAAVDAINAGGYDDSAVVARLTTNEADISTNAAAIQAINESGYDDSAVVARLTTNEGDISTLQTDVSGLQTDVPALQSGKADVISYDLTAQGSTAYRFTGPGLDGDQNPTVYLTRGATYRFVNAMGAHGFEIRTEAGGAAYDDGVTNNGTTNGTVEFTVPMDAPETLAYQCVSHPAMVGTFQVLKESTAESYDDTALAARVTQTESDISTLQSAPGYDDSAIDGRVTSLESSVAGLSNYDDSALAARVTTAEGDISTLQTDVAGLSNYDDTALAGRVTTAEGDIDALETTVAGLSNYDDTALAGRVTTAESDIDTLEATVGGLSNYDDTALAARVTQNESDIATLQSNGGGGSVFDLSDVKLAPKPGGYRFSQVIAFDTPHSLDPTGLPAGQASYDGNGGLFLNPVDQYGQDITSAVQAESVWSATGDFFISVGQTEVYVSGQQIDGVYIESNGNIYFDVNPAIQAELVTAVANGDSITISPVDAPSASGDLPVQNGEVLVYDGSDFRPATPASGFDYTVAPSPAQPAGARLRFSKPFNIDTLESSGFDGLELADGSFAEGIKLAGAADTNGALMLSLKDDNGNDVMAALNAIKDEAIANGDITDATTQGIPLTLSLIGPSGYEVGITYQMPWFLEDANAPGYVLADGTTGPDNVNNVVILYSGDLLLELGDIDTNYDGNIVEIAVYGPALSQAARNVAQGDVLEYNLAEGKFEAVPGGIEGSHDFVSFGSDTGVNFLEFDVPVMTNIDTQAYTYDANPDLTAAANGSWTVTEEGTDNMGAQSRQLLLSLTDKNGVKTASWIYNRLFLAQRLSYNDLDRGTRMVEAEISIDNGPRQRIYFADISGLGYGVQVIDGSGNTDLISDTYSGPARSAVRVYADRFTSTWYGKAMGFEPGTPASSVKIYPVMPQPRKARHGEVVAYNDTAKAFTPMTGLTISHVLNNMQDQGYLFPSSPSDPGYPGEVRIDVYNGVMAIYTQPYDQANGAGGWVQVDLQSLQGGGPPA